MEKIFVVASARAKQGSEDELSRVLKKMVSPTRAEPGCELYELYRADDSGQFFFYERWSSREALSRHTTTPHFKQLREETKSLLDGEFKVHLLTPVMS